MRRVLTTLIFCLLLAVTGGAAAKPLTAQDVRGLLSVSGFNPGTTKLLGDKGIHEVTAVRVHRYHGWWVVLVREKELRNFKFSEGAMTPVPTSGGVVVDVQDMLHLIEVLGVVGALFFQGFKWGGKMQAVELDTKSLRGSVTELKTGMMKLDTVITEIAVSNKRMDLFDQRLDDVVNGRLQIGGRKRV